MLGVNSTAFGVNSLAYGYSCAYGYNSGLNSNTGNLGCVYIGNNSGITANSNFVDSVAIGPNSVITNSNFIQLGTSITTTNCSTLNSINLTIISYSTLPLFITQKYVGYLQSTNSLKFYTSFNNFVNLCQISVSVGIWIVQYQITYNYSASNILAWHKFTKLLNEV